MEKNEWKGIKMFLTFSYFNKLRLMFLCIWVISVGENDIYACHLTGSALAYAKLHSSGEGIDSECVNDELVWWRTKLIELLAGHCLKQLFWTLSINQMY